jgi:hypothetical protein
MLKFLIRIFLVLILAIVFQIIITLYLAKNIDKGVNTYIKNSCFCEEKLVRTKFILGNSHVETGLNDTILGSNYCNLGKNAEPIFYTVVKARKIINLFKVDTMYIEYSNFSLIQEDQVISNERCFQNYQNFFKYMNYDEHLLIWKFNFMKALKTFYSLRNENFMKTGLIGGYAPQVGTPKKVDKTCQKKNYKHNALFVYGPLIDLIKDNPRVVFILFRTPIKKSYLFYEDDYMKMVKSFTKQGNVKFYDFKDSICDENYFYDNNHLNYNGSVKFTNMFIRQMSLGVINYFHK